MLAPYKQEVARSSRAPPILTASFQKRRTADDCCFTRSAFALMEVPAEQREELIPPLEEAMAPFAADRGYVFPGVALAAVAS